MSEEQQQPSVLERLRVPFPAHAIKERRGSGGRMLSYVGGEEYVRRLLDACGLEWSFEVIDYEVFNGDDGHPREVSARCRLTIGGQRVEQFGGQRCDGETIGDGLKGAATDALKKCASLRGLGLHLWLDDEPGTGASDRGPSASQGSRSASGSAQGQCQRSGAPASNSGGQRPGSAENSITEKQHQLVLRLSQGVFPNQNAFEKWCLENHGAIPVRLSKAAASKVIDWLQSQAK